MMFSSFFKTSGSTFLISVPSFNSSAISFNIPISVLFCPTAKSLHLISSIISFPEKIRPEKKSDFSSVKSRRKSDPGQEMKMVTLLKLFSMDKDRIQLRKNPKRRPLRIFPY